MKQIKNFFGVGSVTDRPERNICVYRVSNVADLIKVIIPHFIKYPLISKKYSDFMLWSKVVELKANKQHLTSTGFATILSLYASINKGLSPKVATAFPNIVPANKVEVNLPEKLNPEWFSGFAAGDGGFSIGIRKSGQIYFRFHIAQHSRDVKLMKMLISFFGCGSVIERANAQRCDYYVQSFDRIYNVIIPHFDLYPLCNIKDLDFKSFKEAAILYKEGGRNNTTKIRQILDSMNSKREFSNILKQND